MTPEARLKAKIKRRLIKKAKEFEVEVTVDVPPASMYGTSGRPDLNIFFGPLFFMVEVKAKASGKLSPNQEVWFKKFRENHFGLNAFVIAGENEMDAFFEDKRFAYMLASMVEEQTVALKTLIK